MFSTRIAYYSWLTNLLDVMGLLCGFEAIKMGFDVIDLEIFVKHMLFFGPHYM